MRGRFSRAALHIGVGSDPRFAPLPNVELAVDRMVKVSSQSGIDHQVVLRDRGASPAAVRKQVGQIAECLRPDGLFLLSFAGHGGHVPDTDGDEDDGVDETWHLWDSDLVDDDIDDMVSMFPSSTRIVVVSDSCYSGGMVDLARRGRAAAAAAQVVLISACHTNQQLVTIDLGRMAGIIDTTVFPGGKRDPSCTYPRLAAALGAATTEACCSSVACNRGVLPDQVVLE